jgi:hypothetical protein
MQRVIIYYRIYCCCILCGLIFLVFQNYFSLDEPNILWELRSGTGWTHFYKLFIADGRPIYGWLQLQAIAFAGTLADLKFLRIISVIFTFLFCLQIFNYLQKKGMSTAVAFITVALIFSLPGFSVFISWAQQYPHHFSSMLSFYAGTLVTDVFIFHLGENKLSRSTENKYIFLAIVLQLFSLFLYQSMALAFVIPAFFTLLVKQDASVKNRIRFFISFTLVFFIILGIYYKLFQSMLHSTGVAMTARGTNEGIAPLAKFQFFTGVLKEAGKLHLLLVKNAALNCLFALLILVIIIRDLIKQRFMDLLFLLVFATLLFLPHLLISVSWGASRNFVLISLILVFYTIVRVFELISTPSAPVALFISTLFLGLMFMNIGEGWVKPMKKDYAFMHDFVQQLPAVSKDTLFIKVKPPSWNLHEKKSFLRYYYDEFNAPEYYRVWPITPALKCLYQDTHPGISMDKINRLIQIDTVNSPLLVNKKAVELNLNYQ